ncbi:hypothetical protein [Prescottella agglutinans]|uniref:hypothetical protein n=1 Tax=Prescottella agglutinans TaxID=1644129 RepID=UPI0019D4E76E|nr:hypothetical protein [Prescottella agglutinans]
MSYDIVAFDPAATTDSGFLDWYDAQTEWAEDHDYCDVAVTTPDLRAFYTAIAEVFPPLNGPDAPDDEQLATDASLEGRLTDYSIGTTIVYASFGWSQAERATEMFRELAAEHKVAVALVSHDSPVPIVRPQ